MNTAVLSNLAKKMPKVALKAHRQKLVLSKQSPHIFFGLGLAGAVTSTVLACRATLKLETTLSIIEDDLASVRELRADDAKENGRDTLYVYGKAAGMLGRLYGPSVTLGVVSIAALSGSHVQLTRRNTSLMAAYAAVSKAYDDYRERIIRELGEERELDIYHNKFEIANAETKENVAVVDPTKMSPYARFYDEASPNWEKNAEHNRLFIQCIQNYANERLRARGHLFLNEVYDMLGIERSPEGQIVGWVVGGDGDGYIDLGMYSATNAQFINGWEPRVLLDFNVDGVVYDLI